MMVADNGPLYYSDIPLKMECQDCISVQFNVILMDRKCVFLSKTRTFLTDPKLLNGSVYSMDVSIVMAVSTVLYVFTRKHLIPSNTIMWKQLLVQYGPIVVRSSPVLNSVEIVPLSLPLRTPLMDTS